MKLRAHRGRSHGLRRLSSSVSTLKILGWVPRCVWRPLGELAGAWLAWRPSRPVRQWQLNYRTITGQPPDRATTRAGIRSWLRATMDSLQMMRWSRRRIRRAVIVDEQWFRLLRTLADGGVVVALPHMGSWDLAGAFGSLYGIQLSTVAEELPAGQFAYFRDLRTRFGMTIYSHHDTGALASLRADLRRGRLVGLVADRDFTRHGVPVVWQTGSGPVSVRMPQGPAALAQELQVPLFALVCSFEGSRMRIDVSEPIVPSKDEQTLTEATQYLADFFSSKIRQHPVDWHMMQRFFPGVNA